MFYSFIIPLYNRPDEIKELLESLLEQKYKDFEVVVVEDGSKDKGEEVVNSFKDRLQIQYFYKENGGQGFARNYGMERAKGDYFIILDSDVLVPKHYLATVDKEVREHKLDCFGGPDAAHPSFTPIQKAISYSMTSIFTTGGIRGKKQHVGQYHPRSFNMGVSRQVWEKTGGFKITRMGEDLLFSMHIIRLGFKTGLIEEAYIYHKRRTDFERFWKQLKFFGRARVNIYTYHKDQLKLVHLFPLFFTMYVILCFLPGWFVWWAGPLFAFPLFLWTIAIFIDATVKENSAEIGLLSVVASYIQLIAYAVGFVQEYWKRIIVGKENDVKEYPS